MNDFFSGIQYLLDGFKLIRKPGVKRYVFIPLLINILLFAGLFIISKHYIAEFNLWFLHYLPVWLAWLSTVLWVLFLISFFLIFIATFVTIANIISSPFNSLLAEKVELYLTGALPPQRSVFESIKDVPHILGRQLAIILYFLPRACALFILFFIPVVHLLVPALWFLFNAWFMALTYIDYPTDNHRVSLPRAREWLEEKRWVSFSFGLSVLVTSMIPVLNFFVVPASVAGATKFWLEESGRLGDFRPKN